LGVVASVIPAGRLSVKSRAEAANALALLSMVKVKVLMPPTTELAGAKVFVNPGGGSMVRSAVAGSATFRPCWNRLLVVLG
jgi:hypothetical protein